MTNPTHVLHVVSAMNRGGAETWLLHMLRCIDRNKCRMDFIVHTDEEAAYDSELRSLGARIFSCPTPQNFLQYRRHFNDIVRRQGPYQVLHSHVQYFGGFVLWLGRQAGIPIRIGHSHSDTRALRTNCVRKAYQEWMRGLIKRNATNLLAASAAAAADLYGDNWRNDPRVQVLHCGIDLEPFRTSVDPSSVRAEFGFAPKDIVFGHVGRFVPPKNHRFLVDVAAEIARREPRARFLLVGAGPLRGEIDARLNAAGIRERTVLTGSRPDVPRLLMGAMDAFLFPSVHEGLGLALVEAQAAGLPCIVSGSVPEEADVIPALVHRLSLAEPPGTWAHRSLSCFGSRVSSPREIVASSVFNVSSSASRLLQTYSR